MNRDSSKLRRFVHAAREVGYSKEERRELVQSPADFFAHDDYSGIRKALTPEALASFADTLSGGKGDRKALLTLGNAFYEIQGGVWQESEERWGDGEQRPIPENVQHILSLGFKMVENALYEGTLVSLKSKDAAVLAFLLNRIAKMKEKKSVTSEQVRFDLEKFEALLERITSFAKEFLSPEIIDRARAENEKEQDQILKDWEASGHPLLKEWCEARRAYEEVSKRSETFKTPGFFDAYFADLRLRFQDVPALWGEIFGQDEEHFQTLEDLLMYLHDPSVGDAFRQSLLKKRYRGLGSYLHERGTEIHGHRTAKVWRKVGNSMGQRESFDVERIIAHVLHNFKVFRDKYVPKGKTQRITNMQELADQMRAKKITDTVIAALTELKDFGGPCREYSEALRQRRDLGDKIRELETRMIQDPSLDDVVRRRKDLIAQNAFFRSMKEKLPQLQQQFHDSRDAVLHALQLPAGEAYFVKTLLIVADQRAKHEAEASQRFFAPTQVEMKEQVPVHAFLKSDDRDYPFAEAHYRAIHIPFMQFAVECLRRSVTSREGDNIIETTKE